MTRDFCTLFDVNYLARGLVMWRSLRTVMPGARLSVLCMDSETERALRALDEPGLETLPLAELEASDPAFASTRAGRSRAEYCWTATPALCRYLLAREPALDCLTYLDADLMFWSSPEPAFAELDGDSVQIVPHRYAPMWAAEERIHGIYNVEWLTFKRDDRGVAALSWWRDRCIEWCHATPSEGRFGDQKYLDDWPARFAGVNVLHHPGAGLAPWNVPRHRIDVAGEEVRVDGRPLIFFHFHSLALHRIDARTRALAALSLPLGPRIDEGVAWTTNYPLGMGDRAAIWRPYLRRLLAAHHEVGRSPFVPLDVRKVLRPLGTSARRGLVDGATALRAWRRPRRGGRRDEWGGEAAAQMLDLVERQLAEAETVPPFRGFRYAVEAVMSDPELARPVRLLDVGCGVGHYSELVDRWFGREVVYHGCDDSPEMVATAQAAWPGRSFTQDDVLRPRVDYDGFDVLLAGALVDVLDDWPVALRSLLTSRAPYVILHRQRLRARGTVVRRAPGYADAWTPRTVLGERDLAEAVDGARRDVVLRIPIEGDVHTLVLRRRNV